MSTKTILTIFTILLISSFSEGKLNIVLERAVVKYVDTNYFEQVSASITKLNRASNYLLNYNMTMIHPLYNNASIKIINYQLQSNVYKESIFNINEPVCEALNNKLFLMIFSNYTNLPSKCPMAGYFYIKDLEISVSRLPIFFPISQYRFDASISHNVEKKEILKVQVFLKVEEKRFFNKTGKKAPKNVY